MTNDAIEQVLIALDEVSRYPEYSHKVNWAVRGFILSELRAYGRAWEQTAGPVSERGGSPMEAGEEIVGDAEAALVEKITKVVLAAQAELKAAVTAEREACAEVCSYTVRNYGIMKPGKPDVYASREAQICAKGMVRLVEEDIRARTDPDAQAALDRVKREAKNEAFKEAAATLQLPENGTAGEPQDDVDRLLDAQRRSDRKAILALMEDQSDE